MIDRTAAPVFRPFTSIQLPKVEELTLSNGLEMTAAGYSTQEIFKLELVFNAGYMYTDLPGLNSLFSKMLLGGTQKMSGSQVIESFDRFGGFVEMSQGLEYFTVTLHGLRRYLSLYLESLSELLNESIFPENELELHKKIARQTLQLNSEKPAYLAQVAFKKSIYGGLHPFGREFTDKNIDDISRDDLLGFFEERVRGKQFHLFLSGKVDEGDIEIIERFFGKPTFEKPELKEFPEYAYHPSRLVIERSQNMQSTLRIGKPLIGRTHPAFFKALVTNTAFGGYFGSRLMKNIREEKGFTYGISSSVNPVGSASYWVIGSDVVKENTLNTIQEISSELQRLKETEISVNELSTVKNYMCGSFAGSLTTPFEVMDRYKNLKLHRLPSDYYDHFVDRIQEVTAQDVQETANLLFDERSFSEVIVGERI